MTTVVNTEETAHGPVTKRMKITVTEVSEQEVDSRMYEYTSAANPYMAPVPVLGFDASLHQSGVTRIIPFDLSAHMNIATPATSPNLMANFIRICEGESIQSSATATSQAFYVIRGSGRSTSEHGEVTWGEGDLFVVPNTENAMEHFANSDAALYWISDEPLMTYLGVKPCIKKFKLTLFRKERMLAEIERIKHQPGAEHRNRMGILLGNQVTEDSTKTLTHVLWSLLNFLPPKDAQRPHRHNSVAIDLCVSAPSEGVYTLMGPELDEDGWVKNPIRMNWSSGSAFVTPPGWWHSHHNDTGEPAVVLPMQDAGLLTHQRVLDIRFSTGNSEEKKQ